MILIVLVQLIVLFVNVVLKESAEHFLLRCIRFRDARNKLIHNDNEICDLSARKRRLQLSENVLLAPMSVDVTSNEDKDIKAHFSSLFLKLKLSFSFTVTLINIHNYPSQFPHLLRFVTTRMLNCTKFSL